MAIQHQLETADKGGPLVSRELLVVWQNLALIFEEERQQGVRQQVSECHLDI